MMSGVNIVLFFDFIVGFAMAWVLRGVCDRLEYKLTHLFKKKGTDNE